MITKGIYKSASIFRRTMRFTISLMLAFAGSETEGQEPRTATGDALAVVQSWKDRSERDVPKEILSMVPIELERFLQEAAIPSEGLLFGYDLRLMSVINTEDLVNEGRSLIIVALVGEKVHVRIFDSTGKVVIDKPESELLSGPALTGLKALVDSESFPEASALSREEKQQVIYNATSSAGPTLLFKGYEARSDAEADIVRYEWTYLGVSIGAMETAYLFILEVPLVEYKKGEEWKALISKIVKLEGKATGLKTMGEPEDYVIDLRPPKEWREGDVYSTNPSLESGDDFRTWADRVDVVCSDDKIALVFRKLYLSGSPASDSKWFENEAGRVERLNANWDKKFPERIKSREEAIERRKRLNAPKGN